MALHDRIKEARKNAGMTQTELGEKIGVAKTTIAGYEKNREPTAAQLGEIADALGVDVTFLLQDEMKNRHESNATLQEMEHIIKKYRLLDPYGKEAVDGVLDVEFRRCEAARKEQLEQAAEALRESREQMEAGALMDVEKVIRFSIPGYSMPMSAGTGQEAGLEYPEDYTLVKQPPRGTSYIAPVSGNSMEPTYHDGALLFIHACEGIREGQIGIFLMDGQQWVKELGAGVLISHNPGYDPIPMRDDIRCQGLVLDVCDESYFE